jgi:CBS domain-containing protein
LSSTSAGTPRSNPESGVEPEARIEDAGQLMLDNKLGCLPVVEGERLVGILTEADFVKFTVARARRSPPARR